MLRVVTLSAVLVAAACASSPRAIPVKGNSTDLALVAGRWQGEYEALTSERRGTIEFSLAVGRYTAEGQVLMELPGMKTEARPLKIELIEVEGAKITGTLAPYQDPECNCQVLTQFEGTVIGDLITGDFVSHQDTKQGHLLQRGQWSVTRARN